MEAMNRSVVQSTWNYCGRDVGSIWKSISYPWYWQKMLRGVSVRGGGREPCGAAISLVLVAPTPLQEVGKLLFVHQMLQSSSSQSLLGLLLLICLFCPWFHSHLSLPHFFPASVPSVTLAVRRKHVILCVYMHIHMNSPYSGREVFWDKPFLS